MHKGTFPQPFSLARSAARTYVRGPWSSAELESERRGVTRRDWAIGVLGAVLGAALPSYHLLAGAAPPARATPAPPRGSLEWALGMVDAPEDELLEAAGDLERVSVRHRDEPRLVPCFTRLLDVVLGSRHESADVAGACAVRSLGRLGRTDVVRRRLRDILRRRDLTRTARTAEASLERSRGRK